MSEKKRKSKTVLEQRPAKKAQTSSNVKAEYIQPSATLQPVIATAPGITLHQHARFQAYTKQSKQDTSSLLLHSSSHPTIDYTATEGTITGAGHLTHYVAVFDPPTGTLKFTNAKPLTVRSTIRQRKSRRDSDASTEAQPAQTMTTRADLTEAFGSKKSKKAVAQMTENRQLGQGSEAASITNAITSRIAAEDDADAEISATAGPSTSKPIPRPDLTTTTVSEIYSLSTLIHPSPHTMTLKSMNTAPWIARLNAKKDITTIRSRFVAARIGYIGRRLLDLGGSDQKYLEQVQLLRYIELLLVIHQYLQKVPRGKRIPYFSKWPEEAVPQGTPHTLVQPLLNDLFPGQQTTDHAMTFLRTTILALCLHVLPPSGSFGGNMLAVDPNDVAQDLTMDLAQVKKLYRELGCKIDAAKEKELAVWGLEKVNKKKKTQDGSTLPKPQFAKLALPLEFPKVSKGRRAGR